MLLCFTLLLLPQIFRLDGKHHADWQQFLGRFHPLIVHIPIGLIILIPILEIAGCSRSALREAAGFVLSLSLFSCIGAVTLGYLLAYGSGESGSVVTRHMWGGIALTISILVCIWVRPWWASATASTMRRGAYPALLLYVLLLLAWTAHQGGSLTHGTNYLFEFLPAPLKRVSFLTPFEPHEHLDPDSFYVKHIHPVLDTNCVACHGEGKSNGGLRLDTYASLMRGGDEGPSVIAGQPDRSPMLQRVTLPTGHKKFMPAEGKPPLQPQQIAWIRAWIQQGASPTASSLAGIVIREEFKEIPFQPVGDYASLLPAMHQRAAEEGVLLTPVSTNPADGLILNAVDVASKFGDAQLARFDVYASYIVEVDLARTSVTDASFNTLGKYTHAHAIHLEGTAITGDGLQKLTPLSQLTYLNLSQTKVTQAALAPLRSMRNLHHIYLYDTPAQPIVPVAPAQQASKAP
jgi:uncharacterized membrane protein